MSSKTTDNNGYGFAGYGVVGRTGDPDDIMGPDIYPVTGHRQPEEGIYYHHPNQDMLHNQIGAFFVGVIVEYESLTSKSLSALDNLIEKKSQEFIDILNGKRGF